MAANSRFAVAVHALTALAYRGARGEAWTSSEKLAESIRTNPVVARRAVAALARAGLVDSQPGRGGGARLARAPGDISLAAVYRAVARGPAEGGDGVLAHGVLAPNPNPPNRRCPVSCAVPRALAPVFAAVEDAVDQALGRTTLADVVAQVGPPAASGADASAAGAPAGAPAGDAAG
jgi:DNA-binding IscR family transcriptional regulator